MQQPARLKLSGNTSSANGTLNSPLSLLEARYLSWNCRPTVMICLKFVGRIIVTLLCLWSGMYTGLHHCLNVCECVLVPVCWFYVSMDPRGLIQIKWMNEWMNFLRIYGRPYVCMESHYILLLFFLFYFLHAAARRSLNETQPKLPYVWEWARFENGCPKSRVSIRIKRETQKLPIFGWFFDDFAI